MAKSEHQPRSRTLRLGQLMLLAALLIDTPPGHAQPESDAFEPANTALPDADQRALLLYLGEFDPETDPVELSQMSDDIADEPDAQSKSDETMEVGENAADTPKN